MRVTNKPERAQNLSLNTSLYFQLKSNLSSVGLETYTFLLSEFYLYMPTISSTHTLAMSTLNCPVCSTQPQDSLCTALSSIDVYCSKPYTYNQPKSVLNRFTLLAFHRIHFRSELNIEYAPFFSRILK